MISEEEAKDLVLKLKELKNNKDKNNERQLQIYENLCVNKFKYLITMKLGKYKNFNNYEDLCQEGYEALL